MNNLSIFSIAVAILIVIILTISFVFAYVPTLKFSATITQTIDASCCLQHNGITLFSTDSTQTVTTASVGQNKTYQVQPVGENLVEVKGEYQYFQKTNNAVVFTVSNNLNSDANCFLRLSSINIYGVDLSLSSPYLTVTSTSSSLSITFDNALSIESSDVVIFTIRFDVFTEQVVTGYPLLEYLQSTGTQYIDLGGYCTSGYVEVAFAPTSLSGTTSDGYGGILGENSAPQLGWYTSGWTCGNAGSSKPYAPEVDKQYVYKWVASTGKMYIDGQDTNLARTGNNGLRLKLFFCEGKLKSSKCYWFKQYDANGNLIHYLVPSMRNSDKKVGMLDLVDNNFYLNGGTGDFLYGAPTVAYQYNLNFDSNGGTDMSNYNGVYSEGDSLSEIVPTKPGYYFVGWCLDEEDNNGTGSTFKWVSSDFGTTFFTIILRARWTTDLYTRLEYLEATGSQYIDFGTINAGYVEVEFAPTTLRGTASGGYDGILGTNSAPQLGWYDGGWTCGNAGSDIPYAPTLYTRYTYKCILDTTSNKWKNYIDGTDTTLSRSGANLTLKLFYCEKEPKPSRCYSYKQYDENNTLVYSLLPYIRNTDGVLGMFDSVTNTFYTNDGTGVFVAGPTT